EKSVAGESDVPLFVTYVDSVFAGATSDMVQLRYTWAISKSITEIKGADVFGKLELKTANDNNLLLYNKDKTVSLSKDSTADIMGELKFQIADNDILRYYPKVDYLIGEGPNVTGTVTATATVTGTGMVNATTNMTAVPAGVTTTAGPAGTETAKPPVATATQKEPGFEAFLAVAGLLAVAFLVLRQRK
ncbi:MAG: hypothetical protein J5U17_11615, partial [Candidatus Methanoperedens sp.]|nr:hypothetical protein [Candidatus Methanoperedens sp.]